MFLLYSYAQFVGDNHTQILFMYFDLTEWLNVILHWIHVFAGILWIGQTYFFTWLDSRFAEIMKKNSEKTADDRVWMVHSGGFYIVEKQNVPKLMPTILHWFRWEAAITWLTGIALLALVYWHGGLMVEETKDETTAILVGVGLLILAWPVYELLWRSPLGKNEWIGASISFALIVLVAFGLTHYMGGRAAYMHVGAMFGTIMATSVWVTIIPAQRKMVAALKVGREPDLALAHRAKACSRHNTFMAMPLVFIMISNHFPTATYGAEMGWLVLAALVLAGWGAAKIVRRV
ncbi:MAG: urate hydroxylase PuuD [Bacteroidota bacterium]